MDVVRPKTDLPLEVAEKILDLLPLPSGRSQRDLHTVCLVSRSWYSAGIKYLYSHPIISTKNFELFVRSVCPSVNAHIRRNGLAEMIKVLDMRRLVHDSAKSLTARLLGRTKSSLEEFRAPQSSFAINSLAALSKCRQLRTLDLSAVSERIALADLLRPLQNLERLVIIKFPRAGSHTVFLPSRGDDLISWPPNVEEVHLNGNFKDQDFARLDRFPNSMIRMVLGNYHNAPMNVLQDWLQLAGPDLQYLRIRRFSPWTAPVFPNFMTLCPSLSHLRLCAELLVRNELVFGMSPNPFTNIVRLDLDYVIFEGFPVDRQVLLDKVNRLLFDNQLPGVRKLGINRKLGWTDGPEQMILVGEIDELLKALAREDGENTRVPQEEAGVYMIRPSTNTEDQNESESGGLV